MIRFGILFIFYLVILFVVFPEGQKSNAFAGALVVAAMSVGVTKLFGLDKEDE